VIAMNDLISVVIPVYRVEKYLERCVESVINQTYANLEIILIDDGSPDNSGNICDEYAKIDKRIKVIHKKNGGLSDARNVGIENSKGKYITFIDSDDWIPLNSIGVLYDALKDNKADISSGKIKEVYSEKNTSEDYSTIITKKYNTEDALQQLMYLHGFSNSASGKLYKKELFNTIRYPIGKHYEDLGTTYKIFAASKKIIFVNSMVYYYFQNSQSIMHKKYSSKRLEGIKFANDELKFIEKEYPTIINSAIYRLCYECILVLNDMPYNCSDKKNVLLVLKKYRSYLLKDKLISKKQKLLCYSTIFGQFGIKVAFYFRNLLKGGIM